MMDNKEKMTDREFKIFNGISESQMYLKTAISMLNVFIATYNFDMNKPSENDLIYVENCWDDMGNILWGIKNYLHDSSDKLEEVSEI